MPNPKKIMDTLGSKDLSRSLGSLVAVWEEQGKSKEEIEQMLKDIDKREKKRNKEMKEWEDVIKANERKIKANKKKVVANDLKIKQLQEVRARIRIERAVLEGRRAERARRIAELKARLR